ncbi:hypothetical protein FJT64_021806 [Amphibalanus amphitrite]|uniref:Uncharacterized protein n=1 Tax=Amphibalanus amphitrite TaxID=1232801 RepID=A0A6A4WN96_AMPAM|nr:hypothetical protein FJT64_021806 [Amphibalanus amphitrite]
MYGIPSPRSLQESLDGSDADRLFSELRAASAVPSAREDRDGGLLEAAYGHVITEASPAERVAQVERDFVPPLNLELEVVGRAVPRLLSGYQKNRREEQQVLQSLREEGLIATPAERASSGVSFEIVSASSAASLSGSTRCVSAAPATRLPSATLDRLEARRHRHRRTMEPETDQLAKQRRRRAAEEEKVRKLLLRKQQVEQGQQQVEELQQQLSMEREASLERRVGSAMDKRRRHLNELRQRLREKHDRVKQAPLRRAQVT